MVKNNWLWMLFFIFPVFVWAYIPPLKFITKKMAENSGKTSYLIEQTVTLKSVSGVFRIKEIVSIDSDNNQWIYARSAADEPVKADIFIKYTGQRKEDGKNLKPQTQEFIEPFLFTKSPDDLKKEIEKIFDAKADEVPLRLSRFDGRITFALGKPTPKEATTELPAAWIDQENFYLKKIRFSTESTFEQEEFVNSVKGLVYAKNKTIKWKGGEAVIQVDKVQEKNRTSLLSLKGIHIPSQPQFNIDNKNKPELSKTIEDFYERFR